MDSKQLENYRAMSQANRQENRFSQACRDATPEERRKLYEMMGGDRTLSNAYRTPAKPIPAKRAGFLCR